MNPARSLPVRPLALAASLATGLAATAQETPFELEKAGWYIRAGAYIQLGMSVSVNRNVVPSLAPGIYDDGYVQKDVNQGADGLTSNWGYINDDQIVDGNLQLTRINGLLAPQSLNGFSDGNLYGPELAVGFEFYRFEIAKRDARLGFELALRYGNYSGSDTGTQVSTITRDVDRYDLGGIVPPLAPYIGLPNVPGPLIGIVPVSQTRTSANALSTISTDLDADFYTARFGVWVVFPLTTKLRVSVSTGYSSIYADGQASFRETRTFEDASIKTVTRTSSTHEGDWLPGFYFQPRLAYWFRDWMSFYVTAEYAHNGILRMNGLDYQAQLDFGSTFGASGGVQFTF